MSCIIESVVDQVYEVLKSETYQQPNLDLGGSLVLGTVAALFSFVSALPSTSPTQAWYLGARAASPSLAGFMRFGDGGVDMVPGQCCIWRTATVMFLIW